MAPRLWSGRRGRTGDADGVVRDDFAADSLDRYQRSGAVHWKKGTLSLDAGARFGRAVAAGSVLETVLTVRFPAQPADAELRVSLATQSGRCTVALRPGLLLHPAEPSRTVRLPAAGRRAAWVVRLELHHGLSRAKAWPAGTAEPKEWQQVLYSSVRAAQKAGFVLAAIGGAVDLQGLTVRGVGPIPLTRAQFEQVRQARQLDRELVALRARGEDTEALARAREALALRTKALPAGHADLANGHNNLGAMLRLAGRHDEAAEHYARALAIRRRLLPSEHPRLAAVLHNLALLWHREGKLKEARPLLEEAVAIYRKALPTESLALAGPLATLAMLLKDVGQIDQAHVFLEEVLRILRQHLPAEHADIASRLSDLGEVLSALGRPEEARRVQEQGVAMHRKLLPPEHPHLAKALNNLSATYVLLGAFDRARACLEEALAIRRKAKSQQPLVVAESLEGLGVLFFQFRQQARAREFLEEALALRRKLMPANHPALATALTNLGAVLLREGQLEHAGLCFAEALAIRRKTFPAQHARVADALENVGILLRHLDRNDEALARLEEALAMRRQILPPFHPDLANNLHNLAMLFAVRRQWGRALEHTEQALAVAVKVYPEQHPRTTPVRGLRAELLHRLGRHEEAWSESMSALRGQGRYLRQITAGSVQSDYAAFLNGRGWLLDQSASRAARAARLGNEKALAFLTGVLANKAIATASLMRRQEALLASGEAGTAELFSRLKRARQELADRLLQGPHERTLTQYRALCRRLQTEVDALELKLAGRLQSFADLQKLQHPEAGEVARSLAAGEILIEMLRYRLQAEKLGDSAPLHYAAVLLWQAAKGPQARFVALGEAGPIDEAVRAWRAVVQAGKVEAKADRVLHDRLWQKLAHALPDGTRSLLVAPDGELTLVPLEAVRLPDGRYLVERFPIRYVSSGHDVLPRLRPAARPGPALIVADPAYDALDEAAPAVARAEGLGLRAEGLSPAMRFRSLPGFAREAEAVGKLLAKQPGWAVESLRGARASEEALARVSRPRLLYCVTHGFFLPDAVLPPSRPGLRDLSVATNGTAAGAGSLSFAADPRLRSGLALAGANKWQERSRKGLTDGLLTALEAENLDLWGTELVVLSACETGLGQIQVGEGVLGLRRAFQLAGARTVVASLWKVPDAETEQLMTNFLQRWLKGQGKAEALRSAQLDMIRRLRESAGASRRQAPPLYWAGFICHGDPR